VSETSHTPGPWEVVERPAALESVFIVRPVMLGGHIKVFLDHEGGYVGLKSEADARLIAAAPLLLEAVKATKRYNSLGLHGLTTAEESRDAKEAMRVAVEKALKAAG